MRRLVLRGLAVLVLAAGCAPTGDRPDYASVPRWSTRAIPEARGDVRIQPDGRHVAVRYAGWTTRDYSGFRSYAYNDTRPEPTVQRVTMPAGVTGDPKRGRALFLDRAKGPCTGCHLVPGEDVWPAGSVGPDLSTVADRKLADAYLYQQIWDPRVTFPKTVMPPWGVQGVFTPVAAYGRVMSIEDFLMMHTPETTGQALPRESAASVDLVMRIRMASNGLPVAVDTTSAPARAALARGRATFYRRVGERNHSCADCHTADTGANKFLGGRLLADVTT